MGKNRSAYKDFPHSTCVSVVEGIPFNCFKEHIVWDDVYSEWKKIIEMNGECMWICRKCGGEFLWIRQGSETKPSGCPFCRSVEVEVREV